jgi:hypothetical protein
MVDRDGIFKAATVKMRESATKSADDERIAALRREITKTKAQTSQRAWEVQQALVPEPPREPFGTRWATLAERDTDEQGRVKLIARLFFREDTRWKRDGIPPFQGDRYKVSVPGVERFEGVHVMVAPVTEENEAIIDSPDVVRRHGDNVPTGAVTAYGYDGLGGGIAGFEDTSYRAEIRTIEQALEKGKQHSGMIAGFVEEYSVAVNPSLSA